MGAKQPRTFTVAAESTSRSKPMRGVVGSSDFRILRLGGAPELFKAARTSLELRLSTGGGHTGWSRAWTACCVARLGQGEEAFEHLRALIGDFATTSLLDPHPPRAFQNDGNLGGAAAVIEMLLQSYYGELHFLLVLTIAVASRASTGYAG